MTDDSEPEGQLPLERLEALQRRIRALSRFDLSKHCFEKQRPYAVSRAKFRTASCSRRAGKTDGGAGILLETAQAKDGCVCIYITKTRVNAKRIIWKTLKAINLKDGLNGIAHESELWMEMPNGSSIYLLGANNKDEIEKFRGLPLAIVLIDEAQILTNLRELIDEVIVPALMDYDGTVVLAGTPGPVPVGYFYECTKSPRWEHHEWTVFDNPWILKKSGKTPRQHLDEELARRGVTEDEPSIQREWFGKWVYDPNALVFRYDATRNHYDALPNMRGDWECVVGGDLGWDDADALVVLKWHPSLPDLWLVYEDVMPKQGITALGNKLQALVEEYQPLATVLDFGGLGKKIGEELTQRWSLNVTAADKERKLEHIELLNDAMRTGLFHARADSRFAQDCMLVEWDRTNPEKPKISERFHSDVCDAALYAFRKAKQWAFTPEKQPPIPYGSNEWHEAQRLKLAQQAEAEYERELELQNRRNQEKKEAMREEDFLF